MFNYYRYYRKSGPSSLFDNLGLHSLVAFFSTKVIRGGPRVLLHLAATLVVVLLVVKFAPSPSFSGFYSPTSFFSGNPDQVVKALDAEIQLGKGNGPITSPNSTLVLGDNQHAESGAAGGLRIVVFGEDDVASPSRLRTYRGTRRPSWTELLCHEVHCSSYLSFTQDFDASSYSVVSQELHNAAIKILLDQSGKEATGGGKPGKDYSFYQEKYPIDKGRPDLARQVQSFLAMEKPQNPPSETLWVLTFGTWDIWSLAGMPTSISKPVVGLLIDHIFDQVELLYRSSLHTSSVAFSDLKVNVTDGGHIAEGVVGRKDQRGSFRILIPTLFDPSLTPGWAQSRPDVPAAHSKAEQLRNAAHLTEEWNDQMLVKLEKWLHKPYPTASDIAKARREDHRGGMILPPQRDAFAYDMAGSMIDTIMDEQLRIADLKTQIALGKSSDAGPIDVMKPCVVDRSFGLEHVEEMKNNRRTKSPHTESVERDGSKRKYKNQKPPPSTAVICQAPDEHLFYSAFELSTRTIAAIARQVGGMVTRNESVRAAWDAEERNRQP